MTNFLSVPITARDHVSGRLDAPVVLVEYGDFECPYCGAAYPMVKELQRQFGEDLCFVFRNFPLMRMHQNAVRAAVTAEWAARQGDYWEMHDYLYEHQDELDAQSLLVAVRRLRLDPDALEVAWNDHTLFDRIVEDLDSGTTSGVHATPGFFINEVEFDGPWSIEHVSRALRAAARTARWTPTRQPDEMMLRGRSYTRATGR
jgi:protein-disulfide isomerase